MKSLVSVVLVTGCWTAAEVAPIHAPLEVREVRDATRVMRAPAPLAPTISVWRGTYYCSQGITGMQLTLELDGSDATATFEFEALAQNPTAKSGSYRLKGFAQVFSDGSFEVELDPDVWIVRPANYEMVRVTAITDATRRSLKGRMEYGGCGELEATRIGGT